ncbi:hypothetical protein CAPTEDRAFT_192281 [Capitella teleta]|uniref:Uncharacterized protein n=1 Tax=Capitella teleta TaxID=283909 RepID=R7UIJ9_CAPTE|nr:hypothetical protein CAPTEDRAFT_192281 [Capitella teleta]|eukprot:ELU03092.1 hypothetical protein CAPTEDRAFT_192281 [Capitella teleta]
MQLAMLCLESDLKVERDLKSFEIDVIFRRLISDLKMIENGVVIDEISVKGSLVAIAGDNLGSNGIGGFPENFSTSLPLCLGHDLFEGLVSWDIARYLKYFVQSNFFTYEQLNGCINCFQYLGSDAANKPNT